MYYVTNKIICAYLRFFVRTESWTRNVVVCGVLLVIAIVFMDKFIIALFERGEKVKSFIAPWVTIYISLTVF